MGGVSARRGRLVEPDGKALSSPLWLFNPASVRFEIAPGKDANAREPGIMRYKSWSVNYRRRSTKTLGAADVCGKRSSILIVSVSQERNDHNENPRLDK